MSHGSASQGRCALDDQKLGGVLDMRLKGIGGAGCILLNDAVEDVAMLINDLHQRPGSARCGRAPHQNHVAKRIDVIRKPAIAGECQQGVVEAAITPPHPLLIAGRRRPFHSLKCRSQQTNAVFVEEFHSPPAGRDLEKKPDLKDLIKVVERSLQNANTVVALEADHAARAEIDQRLTNRGSRNPKACGKLPHRVEASGQKIARRDCISKDFGDLLLEAYLLGDRAKGIQAGLRSTRPSPGDFFQGRVIVAQELYLDHHQAGLLFPPRPAPPERNPIAGSP